MVASAWDLRISKEEKTTHQIKEDAIMICERADWGEDDSSLGPTAAWSTADSSPELGSDDGPSRAAAWSWRAAIKVGLVLVVTTSVALVILASHAEGLEHPAFHVKDAVLAALVVGYLAARCAGVAGPQSQAPAALIAAWLAALTISLGSPARRRRVLGRSGPAAGDVCDEGPAALWLALVLGAASPALCAGPPEARRARWWAFAALGQGVSLQHLLVGVALQSEECAGAGTGRIHGLLLGLSPLWAACLQLSALALLLAAGCRPPAREGTVERLVEQYLSAVAEDANASVSNETAKERVTHSIDSWERRCRKLLEDLEPHVDAGGAGSGPQLWAGFADHLAEALRQCRAQLHNRQETSRDVNSQLLRAVKEEGGSGSDVQVLSGWLQQAWDPDGAAQSMGIESLSMDSIIQRPQRTLQRVAGARTELLVGDWSFDALEVESSGHTVMQLVGFELLHTYASLPPGALTAFLSTLEKAYGKEHPYHSYVHAADMCNSFYFLATRSRLWEDGEVSDWIQLTSLIAALGHDVGHFGRNNVFLTSTRHALAVTYNDKSVLENFHASTLIQMLDQCYGSGSDLPEKLLSQQPIERLPRMRHLIILLILHTDPAKHLEDLSAFRVRLGAEDYNPMSHVPGCNKGDQEQAMCMLFRSADISHSAKDWNIHQEWSKRVAQEFHDQGDEEKRLGLAVSPLCDREGFVLASSQVGFLQFICVPTWKELARFEEIVCYLAKEAARSPETHAPRRSSLRLTTRGSQGTDRILSRSQTAMCHSPQPGPCSPGASPRRRRPSPITSAAPFDPKASPLELMQMGRVSSLPSESAGKMSRRSSLSSLQSEKRSSRPFLTLPARAQATAGPHHVAEAPDILERLGKRSSSGDGKLTCVCLRLCEQNLKAWTSLAEEAKPPPSPASRCA